ncbi:MAG: hypothetical protein U5R31_00730 [Acidimicrobiia bacterium]|nr:hypothetical protein [Acidimicrobiia bacterium]
MALRHLRIDARSIRYPAASTSATFAARSCAGTYKLNHPQVLKRSRVATERVQRMPWTGTLWKTTDSEGESMTAPGPIPRRGIEEPVTREHLDRRIAEVRTEIAHVRTQIAQQTNRLTIRMAALATIASAAAIVW